MLTLACPTCGAELKFANRSSLVAVCAACGGAAMRKDINLETLGRVGDLLDDGTTLALGASGTYKGRPFAVIGRLQIAYASGFWNDWYLQFERGEPGWMSESMGFYAILREVRVRGSVPPRANLRLGERLTIAGASYWIRSFLQGTCVSAEGELPMPPPVGETGRYVDLLGEGGGCAAINYFGDQTEVYAGSFEAFEDLRLDGLRRPPGW